MGCDEGGYGLFVEAKFLLTHPVWDVTIATYSHPSFGVISTHTSRVGCDEEQCEEVIELLKFLLTHPVWDVTTPKASK